MKVTFEGEGQTRIELEWFPGQEPSPTEDRRQDRFVDDVVRLACKMAIAERKFLNAETE